MASLCVLGLGYVGLPTAAMFATAGQTVLGVDPDPRVQAALSSGRVHLQEPDLDALVGHALHLGRLRVATAPEPADAFIISVPTPLDAESHTADLSYVERAAHDIVPHLRPGNLVVLESTVPPRTTRDVLAPILARSGLEPGRDLHVAHCPERVLPGRILVELAENDRPGRAAGCDLQGRRGRRARESGRARRRAGRRPRLRRAAVRSARATRAARA